MFKRVRWIGMGAVAGVSASAWAQRRVRRTLDQHPSIQVGADVATTARQVGREVAAAVRDGRRAMVQREAALRADLAARSEPRPQTGAPAQLGGAPRLHVVEATSTEATPRRRAAVARSDRSGHPTAGPVPLHLQAAEPPAPDRPRGRERRS